MSKIIKITEQELRNIIESYIDSSGQLKDFSFEDNIDEPDFNKFSSRDANGNEYHINDFIRVIETGETGKVLSLDAGYGSLIKFEDRKERLLTNKFTKL